MRNTSTGSYQHLTFRNIFYRKVAGLTETPGFRSAQIGLQALLITQTLAQYGFTVWFIVLPPGPDRCNKIESVECILTVELILISLLQGEIIQILCSCLKSIDEQ